MEICTCSRIEFPCEQTNPLISNSSGWIVSCISMYQLCCWRFVSVPMTDPWDERYIYLHLPYKSTKYMDPMEYGVETMVGFSVFFRVFRKKNQDLENVSGVNSMKVARATESEVSWCPSNIEWDLTNGPRSVSCDRAIRYSGLGVRETWVLLEISWLVAVVSFFKKEGKDHISRWCFQTFLESSSRSLGK